MTKRDNQRTGNTEVVESPTLDMNFDFADAPPAIKEPVKVEKVEQPILSKRMKRMKDNLRIDMVGYEQKNYVTRSYPKKRRK
ncbi:8567_t:CDS:2 [Rhizophagus irregularis]|nr:8567_t:CDS:2 [Rhizophagus irregularis]